MKILIIGWYGTETIGDRAILAALIMQFTQTMQCEFSIASIYPFFSKRTIKEDAGFISEISNIEKEKIENIDIIDARNPAMFKQAIIDSDCVVMGGGPLDDMMALYMIQFAVLYAKKKHKKVVLYGIGLNALKKEKYIKTSKQIIEAADCVILRDTKAFEICQQIDVKKLEKIKISIDPAVFAAMQYKKRYSSKKESFVAINLREFPQIYATTENKQGIDIDALARRSVKNLIDPEDRLVLVPMNYFDPGIDDRIILHKLMKTCECKDVEVVDMPYNLKETFDTYQNAKYCIGMRFHAVVFQTILNGNNYILDYTNPQVGKTGAFIRQINGNAFYDKRTIMLQDNTKKASIVKSCGSFIVDEKLIDEYEKIYKDEIGAALCIR